MELLNLNRHQDTLILYIGDYDPSGMGMSALDLPRRLARYSSNAPADKDVSLDSAHRMLADVRMEIRRVALTRGDTIALGPATRFPASDKSKDSRHSWFVRDYGQWCWELDALSPNVLRDRLEQVIRANLDREAWDQAVRVEELEQECINEAFGNLMSISGQDRE